MLERRSQREGKEVRENNGGTLSKYARFMHKIVKKHIKKTKIPDHK